MRRNSRTLLHVVQLCAALLTACGSKSSDNGGADGTHAAPSGPGDFSSVWQAANVEVTVFDTANPMAVPPSQTVELPALVKEPTSGANIELYVTFDGSQRITYGRYENTNVYYRISEPYSHAGEGTSATYSTTGNIYMLKDGILTLTTTRFADGKNYISKTTFRKIDFPPAGWPTEKIDYQGGDSL